MNLQGSLISLPGPCTYAFLWPSPSIAPLFTGWLGAAGDPCVRWDGQRFRMWFGAYDFAEEITQIGYAASADGVQWTIHPEPVLKAGGAWDRFQVETPSVLRVGQQWHLWYCAHAEDGIYHIGHAWSDDGIVWTRDPENPVMRAGSAEWNIGSLIEPTVLRTGRGYEMWAVGIDGAETLQLGHARSSDGRRWTVDPSPLLPLTRPGTQVINSAIEVISRPGGYELFFLDGVPPDLYGTSPDGITWALQEGLVLPRAGYPVQWVSSPSIVRGRDQSYHVWYTDSRVADDLLTVSVRLAHLKSAGLVLI